MQLHGYRINITWAGASKWATREGGDAISVTEGATGMLIGLIVDVQGSGSGAGALARSMTTLAAQLAGEGLDASSIASAVHTSLWTRRGGRVLADVAVLAIPRSGPAEIARYGAISVATLPSGIWRPAASVPAAGGMAASRPAVDRMEPNLDALVVCSDGVADSPQGLALLVGGEGEGSVDAAEVVRRALARDGGRAKNDMSAIVVRSIEADMAPPIAVEGRMVVSRRLIAGR